ncbi:MAG: hypothetical protein RLZZ370_1473 [Bacteroidota bacterium]
MRLFLSIFVIRMMNLWNNVKGFTLIVAFVWGCCSFEAQGQKDESPQVWAADTAMAAAPAEPVPVLSVKIKKYPSLLWEISGNGAKKKSYLYGTMHVSRRLAFRLSDTFFMGLKNADVVALESDPGTWINHLAEDQNNLFPWNDWWSNLEDNDYQEALSLTHPQNRTLARIISREENLANSMLYRKDDRSGDFSEDTYLDLFIYQAGKKLGKTVIGLEDYRESRKMVNRSEKEDKDEDDEDRPRINRWEMNFGEEIENAYRQGDLDLLDSLDRLLNPGKNYRKWMLFERNKVMANGIHSNMQAGKSIFSGVGASHLPGDTGVIELLRRMGYTVRPVSPKSSGKARKEKDRIDALEYKISPLAYKSVNSDFEALMPGVPISAYQDGSYRYFHPDAANGSYISIAKVPYYGKFTGQTPAHMLLRVDSLLFEYVRGRIISKNNLSRNGFEAMDIRNRTAQGNAQRLMVVATPTYLWFVKMSGQKDYVFGKNGESFFNSFKITESAGQNWTNYSPESGGYSLRWPENLNFKPALGDTHSYLQGHRDLEASDKNGDYYFLRRLVNTDVDYVEEDSFELYWLAQGLAENLKSKVTSHRHFRLQGHPAMEARMKSKSNGSNATVRMLIQGHITYVWGTSATENQDFLESFKLQPFKYAKPFTLQHDSMHWFSTVSLPIINFNQLKESMGYVDDEDADSMEHYESGNENMTFTASTGEFVTVYARRFHYFDREVSLDSLWNRRIKQNLEDNFYVVSERKSKIGSWETLDLEYSDTGSSRVVKARWYMRGRMSWCVATTYDSIEGLTSFVRSFYDNFKPFDTFTTASIFDWRGDELLKMMTSKDSTIRTTSQEWGEDFFEPKDHQATELMRIIEQTGDPKQQDFRHRLITKLGTLKHPELIPFLRKQYQKAGDTSDLQIHILSALASMKTKEAAKAYAELLIDETPLGKNEDLGREVLLPLYDSLKLYATTLPALFDLLRYTDYKEPLLHISAEALDSGFLKPADYAAFKKTLLMELRDGWKRLKSEETSNNDYRWEYREEKKDADAAMRYRYSGTGNYLSEESGSTDQPGIVLSLTKLLLPFMPDPDVNKRILPLLGSRDKLFCLMVAEQLIQKGKTLPDTLLPFFFKEPLLRYGALRMLYVNNQTSLIPDSLKDVSALAKAYITFDEVGKKDSLIFLKTMSMEYKNQEGKIYFYRFRAKDEYYGKPGKLTWVWLPNELNSKSLNKHPESGGRTINQGYPLEQQMKDVLLNYRFEKRKRWVAASLNNDSDWEYTEYE